MALLSFYSYTGFYFCQAQAALGCIDPNLLRSLSRLPGSGESQWDTKSKGGQEKGCLWHPHYVQESKLVRCSYLRGWQGTAQRKLTSSLLVEANIFRFKWKEVKYCTRCGTSLCLSLGHEHPTYYKNVKFCGFCSCFLGGLGESHRATMVWEENNIDFKGPTF